jgi:hypothetical protein
MSKTVCLSVRLPCIHRKNGYLGPSIGCPCQARHPGAILCTCTIGRTMPEPSQPIPSVNPGCICCSSQCPCLSCLPEHLEPKLPVRSFPGIPHSKYFPVWVNGIVAHRTSQLPYLPPYALLLSAYIFFRYYLVSVVPCIPPRQFPAPQIYFSATHLCVRPRLSQDPRLVTIPYPECPGWRGTIKM